MRLCAMVSHKGHKELPDFFAPLRLCAKKYCAQRRKGAKKKASLRVLRVFV